MLALPIIHHDSLLGVLTLIGRQPFHLRADEQELLQSFVAQTAVAIRNASLYAAELQPARKRKPPPGSKASSWPT